MTKEQVLNDCLVEGMVIKLPNVQLERKVYQDVAKSLELIGGKWKGGKVAGFVFNEDPTDYLKQLQGGEKRNLKKEFQFFATPDDLCDRLVLLAEITPEHRVLEPSAGQGAIIKAINRAIPEMMIECFELMPLNQTFLNKIDTAVFIGDDFLSTDEFNSFDIIIANPPFSKNQDIDHVMKMYECLKPGGRLVSIMSNHWVSSMNKKETKFRDFINNHDGAEIIRIDRGEFKESGTMVETCIVVINKP